MKHMTGGILLCAALIGAAAAYAEEEGPTMSYAAKNPDEQMVESVSAQLEWARGELDEHVGEGLFKKHPADRQLLEGMLALAKELQGKASAAQQAGDAVKARVHYHAAEAVANYAARMPHMLEHRAK